MDPKKMTVGTVGRFIEEKGHIYLYQAIPHILARHPDTQFLIVGDGRLRNKMENFLSDKRYRKKVHMVGLRDDIPDMLSVMDVFVFPSLLEACPIAPFEAMAARCPVACSSIPPLKENIIDNETGIFFEPADPISMASAVNRLLENPELRQKLCERAFKSVKEKYTERRSVHNYENLYIELLNKSNLIL